jgi:hypothetical protein
MRRLLTLAAFLLLLSLAMFAQRGGGHGGFSGHGGGGHFSGGHSFSGHSFGGMQSSAGFKFSGGGFGPGHFHGGGFRGGFRDHHFHNRFAFGYPWYGYGYGYGYGYYDPFWWSDSYSSYDYDQERDQAIADEENAVNLQQQNLRQREEWHRFGNSEDQDAYARSTPSRSQAPANADPATVLVFRDQHRQEISNYAIAGGTLWVLSEQSAKKIRLADIDLEATAKANDERGVEFQIPK